MTKQTDVLKVLNATTTAYSRERYGEKYWKKNIESLLTAGFSVKQVTWLMNSKYARWSHDAFCEVKEGTEEEILTGTELRKYHAKWGFINDNNRPIEPSK